MIPAYPAIGTDACPLDRVSFAGCLFPTFTYLLTYHVRVPLALLSITTNYLSSLALCRLHTTITCITLRLL